MSVRSITSRTSAPASAGTPARAVAPTVRRSVTGLAAVVVALLVLAGCGKDDKGGVLQSAGALERSAVPAAATPAFLAQSADRTVAVQTGRVEGHLSGPGLSVELSGSFDTSTASAALSVSAVIEGGHGSPNGGRPGIDPGNEGGAHSADIVIADGAVYVRPDGFAGALGEAMGTPWVKASIGELASLAPGDVELPTIDPTELAAQLEREGVTVTEVGPETVRGVATTRYRAEVAADAAQHRPAGTLDVWVDDAGLIRRIDGASGDHLGRIELFDLGEPVSITTPAPDQVTDLGDLSALEGLFGNRPR